MKKTNQFLKIGNKEFNSRLLVGTGKDQLSNKKGF